MSKFRLFGFLRLSNMPPSFASSFDSSHHLMRGDVIFGTPGAHIIVKWAKAMQCSSKHRVVQIPSLPNCPLCPVSALKAILSYPAPPSAPFFPPSSCPFQPYHSTYDQCHSYQTSDFYGFEPDPLWVPCIQTFSSVVGHRSKHSSAKP